MSVVEERVSVVIPAHDSQDTIVAAIDSALRQTAPPFEILVVDDASSDGTAQAVERVAAKHPSVRLLQLTPNGGVSRARNAGIDAATGEWIALLDADDLWLPSKLQKQLEFARSRPELAIIGSYFQELFGTRVGTTRTELWWPSAVFARRSVFDDVRFDPSWRTSEMPEFFSRFDEHYARDGVREPLMRYRMNTTGIAHRTFRTERMAWLLIGENRNRRRVGRNQVQFGQLEQWYRRAHTPRRRYAFGLRWRGERLLRRALIEASQRRFGRAAAYGAGGALLSPGSLLGSRGRFGSLRRASRRTGEHA